MLIPLMSLLTGFQPIVSAPQNNEPPAAEEIAIVGARIEIGDGTAIASGTVVIRNGKIVQVLSTDSAPDGVKSYDAHGKVLYPGFINAFSSSHVKSPPDSSGDGRPSAVSGPVTVMWVGNRKGVTPEFKVADNLEFDKDTDLFKMGVTTAMFSGSHGCLRGISAVVDLLPPGAKERVVSSATGQGIAFRVGGGAGYPSNVLGGIALLRQVLADAKSMHDGVEMYPADKKKPAWANSLEALQPTLDGKTPAFFEASQERELERVMRTSDEFGIKPIIVGGKDSFKVAATLIERKIAVIYFADAGPEPSTDPPSATAAAADTMPTELRKERHQKWDDALHNPEKMAAAGVKFAFSNEGASDDFLKNIRTFIAHGLPKAAALKALTTDAAAILGVSDQVGSITEGKRANFVLMDGDFENAKTNAVKVWIDGRPVYETKETKK